MYDKKQVFYTYPKRAMKRKKGYFSISAVAKMFEVHQQTIRLYEKEGLISPQRSAGNTRLFSEDDIDRLEEIIYLTHQMGINLAGVEMVLKLKKQIDKMQKEMNKMFENTQQELQNQAEHTKDMVRTSAQRLVQLKKITAESEVEKPDQSDESDGWDLEYDTDS